MKFNKPINRDIEIAGNAFVVSMDDTGIAFRLNGKRKTVRIGWEAALDRAEGENGERAFEYLGLGKASVEEPVEDTSPSELSHSAAAGDQGSEP
jgi:hypothetical protein